METYDIIPSPRNGKPGWYEKFREHNFLLNQSPSKIMLIGDSLISNLSRYSVIWRKYFSSHNTLNFGIPRDKIQNVLWRIQNLKCITHKIKHTFILCGTNNLVHNNPEDIANGIMSVGISAKKRFDNSNVVIISLLHRDKKHSLRRGNIAIINSILEEKSSAHNLHFLKHCQTWLQSDNALNMNLFYQDHLHLIKEGNELLAKEIIGFYKQLSSIV